MGFLDRVKEQAAAATQAAKDAAQKGQAKLDAAQAHRVADGLLRDYGAVCYAEQTGRATASTSADMERLLGELRQHEEANGPIDLSVGARGGQGSATGAPGGSGSPSGGSPPPPPPSGQSV
jgi:hypothetical protein